MSNPIITLTTDYGTNDHLVGVLKGVILRIAPNASIVDINHHVVPFDVLDGALSIAAAYRYFPARTVHLVVVDPGVGTARRPILVTADEFYFVAPDNGVLSLIYERESAVSVRHITAEHYFLNPVCATFHGRDIFVLVSIFIPKLRLILILNSFLGSSDSLVFSELFHYLAPRPLGARSISDFLLTYFAT